MRAQVLDEHLLLAAKAAADARLDDADLARGQTQQRCDHTPHVEGHLCACSDHQAVVLVPPAQHDVRLDCGLLHLVDAVLALIDVRGPGQRGVDVAEVHVQILRHVARSIVDLHGVGFVVDDRRPRLHGLHRVEDGGQNLVLDLDEFQRLLENLGRLGGDDSHAIADMAHLVVQAHLVVGRRVGVALPAGGIQHALHVLVGQHRVHARQRQRLALVDAHDAGVGVRAGEQAAVEHARHLQIVGKNGAPLDELERIDLRLRLVDDGGFGRRQLHRHRLRARLHVGAARLDAVAAIAAGRPFPAFGRVDDVDGVGRQLLATQLRRRTQHRFHRLEIARAAAEHARQRRAHLAFRRVRVFVQQLLGGQQLRRRAEAALDGATGDELLLQRVQIVVARAAQPFGGDDGSAVGLRRQHDAAVDKAVAVRIVGRARQQHCIGATLARLIAMFDAEITQAAQCRAQQFTRVNLDCMVGAVNK